MLFDDLQDLLSCFRDFRVIQHSQLFKIWLVHHQNSPLLSVLNCCEKANYLSNGMQTHYYGFRLIFMQIHVIEGIQHCLQAIHTDERSHKLALLLGVNN
jgi:hypothetical protein